LSAQLDQFVSQRKAFVCEQDIVKSDSHIGLYFQLFDRQFLLGSQNFLRGDCAVELEFPAANDFLADSNSLLLSQSAAAKLLALVANDGIGTKPNLEVVAAGRFDTSGCAAD
jgi:hypothetical protein